MKRFIFLIGSLIAVAIFFSAAVLFFRCGGREETGPNIILIALDTFRADKAGCYGNLEYHTPNIDGLARESTVFLNAYAPMPCTCPSHATMFTGLYPREHKVYSNWQKLDNKYITLAERLKSKGYETAAFVSFSLMLYQGGLAQGFDTIIPRRKEIYSGVETNSMALKWLREREKQNIFDRLCRKIDLLLGRKHSIPPFFLWVHYFDTHSPYVVTPYSKQNLHDYNGVFKNGASLFLKEFDINRYGTDENFRALHILYEGEVREIDRCVGEIISSIEKQGLKDNTIVMVVADHGEMLGEHGAILHGIDLWEDALRVPFIIYDPRNPGYKGVNQRVQLIDLAPTVLDLLGLPFHDGIKGRSIADAVRGKFIIPVTYYARFATFPEFYQKKEKKWKVAVYSGDYKLILFEDDRKLLFNLQQDPDEKNAISTIDNMDLSSKMEALAKRFADTDSIRAQTGLDEETVDVLRSLGYIQ